MIADARLGWTLIHFVWQGALVALALWALLPAIRSARARYALSLVALAACAIAPVMTQFRPAGSAIEPQGPAAFAPAPASSGPIAPPPIESDWIAWLPTVWAAGVALFSVRLLAAWWSARRLTRDGCSPLEHRWRDLAARMGVTAPVRFLESARATVPAVVGALRPVVLLPSTVLSKLPLDQLEAVIAHELAHIRRHDYLVNCAQRVIETVLFYHPAVWWISAVARREREVCCDELALEACGHDRTVLAHALLGLEEMRSAVAMAATGGDLADRVRRILGEPPRLSSTPLLTLACIAAVALMLVPGRAVPQAKQDPRDEELARVRQELKQARIELENTRAEMQSLRAGVEKQREAVEAAKRPQGIRAGGIRDAIEEVGAAMEEARASAARTKKSGSVQREEMEQAMALAGLANNMADLRRLFALATLAPYLKWAKEDVVYIMTSAERAEFERLKTGDEYEAFIGRFWKKRDPSPATEVNEAKEEHYRRIAWANERLGMKGLAGWMTHRGRMYIVTGPPDEIRSLPEKEEIWTYRQAGGEKKYWFDLTENSEPKPVR